MTFPPAEKFPCREILKAVKVLGLSVQADIAKAIPTQIHVFLI